MSSAGYRSSIRFGWTAIRKRPGLTALLFAVNLIAGLVVSIPVYRAFQAGVGDSGFGADLAAEPSLVVIADIIENVGPTLGAAVFQFLWLIPLFLLWKVASSVGVINALRNEAEGSFWEGIGRFTGRGLVLGLGFLVLGLLLFGGIMVVLGVIAAASGEKAQFLVAVAGFPLVAFGVFSLTDLIHDYSRISLVVKDQGVFASFADGLKWPFRHRKSFLVYATWWILALAVVAVPSVLDRSLPAITSGGIWGLFLLQQLVLLARAALTVGWFGSEVHLYEETGWASQPLIAETDEPSMLQPAVT